MGKIGIILLFLVFSLMAEESAGLQKKCLECHRAQQIPDNLVYKRYLMLYSTKARIEDTMYSYLSDPKKEHSIMPAPFFLKFPMKEKIDLDEVTLKQMIEEYIEAFDIQKRLVLEEKPK